MIDSTVRASRPGSDRGIWRELIGLDAIRRIGLSLPFVLVGWMLFGSYLLRMTAIPWPFPRDATNYAAIVVACAAAIAFGSRLAPFFLLGLLTTLPSVYVSPNFEDSGLRWIGWGLLITAVGPVLTGPAIFRFRLFMLLLFIAFVHLASIGSGILGLVGIQAPGGRGAFWGLLSHSNVLGTVASLAALDSFSKWSSSTSSWSKKLWFVLLVIELTTSLRAASRAALLAFLASAAIIAFVRDTKSKSQLLLVILVVSCASFGYYAIRESEQTSSTTNATFFEDLKAKGLRNTRERLWQDRIREFESSPMLGVGFCMGGLQGMRVREDGFVQEPGSSYLAALSMTGIVGSIGFLILISPLIVTSYSLVLHRYGSEPPFYALASPFWLIAMLTEGFSHYVGNPFCFVIFLWCGVAASAQQQFPNQDPTYVKRQVS